MDNENGEVSSEAAMEMERMQLDAEFKKIGELCGIGDLFSKLEPMAKAVIESKGTGAETDNMAKFQALAETEIDQIDGDRALATIGNMALNASLYVKRGLFEYAAQTFDFYEAESILLGSKVSGSKETYIIAQAYNLINTICGRLENLNKMK